MKIWKKKYFYTDQVVSYMFLKIFIKKCEVMWYQPGDSSRDKKWLENSKDLDLDLVFLVCGGIFLFVCFLLVFLN